MDPPLTAAASFVPSDDDATELQLRDPELVRSVQLAPESVLVKILSRDPVIVAAVTTFVPSEEHVIDLKKGVKGGNPPEARLTDDQLVPPSVLR
jgi:hypothetical protein